MQDILYDGGDRISCRLWFRSEGVCEGYRAIICSKDLGAAPSLDRQVTGWSRSHVVFDTPTRLWIQGCKELAGAGDTTHPRTALWCWSAAPRTALEAL